GLEEFDIEEDFDEGGYGWIFKARHKVDRKCYAVKIVKYDGMPTKQMIATAKRCLYIQMEFCEGGSLDQWLLDKGKERSKGEATEIFQQIVKGVEYIHSSGHIHRDLKPQNILFAADGRIKIGDFGLVTTIGDKNISPVERTKEKGTKSYMSPEQENQSTYDEKTDIFPLGLIFFELLWTMGTMAEKNK
ncbi:hypothetical protein Z043_125812, partial [Scleropages formosus]